MWSYIDVVVFRRLRIRHNRPQESGRSRGLGEGEILHLNGLPNPQLSIIGRTGRHWPSLVHY